MVTFLIKDLKQFLSKASSIKSSRRLPILEFLRINCSGDTAKISKSNIESFIVGEVPAKFEKDFDVLVEESVLSASVNFAKGQNLTISVKSGRVILDDGFSKDYCSVQDVTHFPATYSGEHQNKTFITQDFLIALGAARDHILTAQDSVVRTWHTYAHVQKIKGSYYILASDNSIGYTKKVDGDFFETSFDPDIIDVIKSYPVAEYFSSEKFHYFLCGENLYGFAKSEIPAPKFEQLIDRMKSDDYFVIERESLLLLCRKVAAMNTSNIPPELEIKNSKKGITVSYLGIAGDKGSSEEFETKEKTSEVRNILFSPKNMAKVLKNVDGEFVKIEVIPGNMIISSEDEPGYKGSVMELQKL